MAAAPNNSNLDPKLPDKQSLAEIVAGKQINKSFVHVIENPTSNIEIKAPTTFKGEPAVIFSKDDIKKLAIPFKFTLIGKFSSGRPSIESVRKLFGSLNLKSHFHIGLLDDRHVLIRLNSESDFVRIWLKDQWYIYNYPMKILKWTTDFLPNVECPIVPIWILLPTLPLHFFDRAALCSIAQVVGKPLQLDSSTATLARPSVARICVECDISKPLIKRVWMGCEDSGFWQSIEYENLPKYCKTCCRFGHTDKECSTDVIHRMDKNNVDQDMSKQKVNNKVHVQRPSKQDNNNQRWTPIKNKEGRSENSTHNQEAQNETPRENQDNILVNITQNMPTKSVDTSRGHTIAIDNNPVNANILEDTTSSNEGPGHIDIATHNELVQHLDNDVSMESQADGQNQDNESLECPKSQDFEEQDNGCESKISIEDNSLAFSDDEYDAFLLHRIEDPFCTPKAWKMRQVEDFKLVVSKKNKKKEKTIANNVTNFMGAERSKSADRERPKRIKRKPARLLT